MHLLVFCIVLTLINSSKLILPSWSRSPVAIRFSVISLTLYPGRGKQAALNKSFNSLQLMYPLPSVSARQGTTGSLRAIQVTGWRGEGRGDGRGVCWRGNHSGATAQPHARARISWAPCFYERWALVALPTYMSHHVTTEILGEESEETYRNRWENKSQA